MEVKIQIPDNCELIKDGDTYIVKEKIIKIPGTWTQFCENYPIKASEAYINYASEIETMEEEEDYERDRTTSKNLCISEKEAEAFLALMQLRQLRKAWVGDWKESNSNKFACIKHSLSQGLFICDCDDITNSMSFPDDKMAVDFLCCFEDLCETAKMLL